MLPSIIGYRERALKPGDRLAGLARDAVTYLDVCNDPEFAQDFNIRAADVRGNFKARPDAIRVYLAEDITVDFWWARNAEDLGLDDLRERLFFLRGLLRARGPRTWNYVNLTLDNYEKNTVVE